MTLDWEVHYSSSSVCCVWLASSFRKARDESRLERCGVPGAKTRSRAQVARDHDCAIRALPYLTVPTFWLSPTTLKAYLVPTTQRRHLDAALQRYKYTALLELYPPSRSWVLPTDDLWHQAAAIPWLDRLKPTSKPGTNKTFRIATVRSNFNCRLFVSIRYTAGLASGSFSSRSVPPERTRGPRHREASTSKERIEPSYSSASAPQFLRQA